MNKSVITQNGSVPEMSKMVIDSTPMRYLGILVAFMLWSCEDSSNPPAGSDTGIIDAGTEAGVTDGRVMEASVADGRGEEPSASIIALHVIPANYGASCNESVQFTANGKDDQDGIYDLTAEVEWSVSDSSVATIDTQGQFTALEVSGAVQVTATYGTLSAKTAVNVICDSLQSIQISPPIAQSFICGTPMIVNFEAHAFMPYGTSWEITDDATWSSSDPSVATVQAGVATPVDVGDATILVTYQGLTASAALLVQNPALMSMAVSPQSTSVLVGQTVEFKAKIMSACPGEEFDVTQIATWSSSAPDKATIDASGVVTALEAGTTTIKAIQFNFEETATLTIQ